jgi:hypothetical protein
VGVTIDSIQIEIESNSEGAARGIDALAKSLEGLKKNGSFKTVSNNLNNLSTALNNLPNVHRASNALRTLANSIEKLKGVGSVTGLANSLKKLPEGLVAIGKINLDTVAPKIQKIAEAVAPLSAVKAGGLNTMMNSLKKLGEVTKSLDEGTIAKFTEKVAILNAKLGPLSEKMTSIKAGFSAINSGARKAASGVKEFGSEINASTLNASSLIDVIQTVADVLQVAIQKFSEFIAEAIEWDGIAARFGRSFGDQADETYAWIQRLNEEMGINVQQFMQYSSLYAQMLTGFGVASKDATEMALGYTELTYDIWASANDRYKSFEDAAEAVASAIAGEVEPIRRAGFTIVEATLAETAAYHGLDISLANATEAQKSYLRYLTLVDQAHSTGTVGVYAAELNTAEGMMRTFSQQLKSLTQAFGSLFLPILVKVMPYLQAFVELLEEGVRWLASLFGVEIQDIGDTWKGYGEGAGAIDKVADSAGGATNALNSATKAAKELKNATLGIDELNVISPQSATGGSGGGNGGGAGGSGSGGFAGFDIDSLWDETIFDSIQSDVDAIKEKMRGWLPVIGSVATALGGLRLVKLLKDVKAIEKILIVGGLIKKFAGFVSAFVLLAAEGGFIATLAAAFPKIANSVSKIAKAASKIPGNLGAFFSLAKEGGVIQALAAAFPKIANAMSKITSKLGPIGAIIAGVTSAIVFLVENWEKLKEVVKNFFAENIAPKFASIKEHIGKMKEALEPLTPVFDAIGTAVSWLGDAFGWLLEAIGGVIVSLTGGALAGAFNAVVSLVEGVVQAVSGCIQIVRGFVDFWVALFTGGDLLAPIKKMGEGIIDVFVGLYDSTIGIVVEFVKGIISWFTEMWDVLVGHSIVPDTINAIVKWFLSLPGKVLGNVGNFVKDVIGKFSNLGSGLTEKFGGAWEKVKSWWSKKPTLSTYTPNIGSIYDKLKARWDNARIWWNDKKTKAKEYTPAIGSIYEKLYDRWKNARDWWNNKKGSLSYTPSIGSIVNKVKSAWNSAKSWWNKNANLSTKLDVKVPKITVKWDTASAFGKSFKYPTGFSLKFAANGGVFDQGSLIWAGERGPEIMANAGGGRTGVMNVQQMQDAVYEGVYAAVSAAMRGMSNGGSQEVRVYLDGREISSSVRKHQHESGATIMGNEVYAY